MNKTILNLLERLLKIIAAIIKLIKKEPQLKEETIEEMIRRVAEEYSVDPDLAVRVAKCESSLNPIARNVNSSGSIDRGLYQWNSYWHPEITPGMADNPETATRLFCKAVKEGNLYWWNATRSCWDK